MFDQLKFPWVVIDPNPILGKPRPRSARELFRLKGDPVLRHTYTTLYRAFAETVGPIDQEKWNWLERGAVASTDKYKGLTYKEHTDNQKGIFLRFYDELGKLKGELKKEKAEGNADIGVELALGQSIVRVDWAEVFATIEASKRMIVTSVSETLQLYADARNKEFTDKTYAKIAGLIDEKRTKLQSAEGVLRQAVDAVKVYSENLKKMDDKAKRVLGADAEGLKQVEEELRKAFIEFYRACYGQAQGLRNAADECMKWAKKAATEKAEAGFQVEHEKLWYALHAGKIGTSVIGTVIAFTVPLAAPVAAALGVAVMIAKEKYIEHVADETADYDYILDKIGKRYVTPMGKASKGLNEKLMGKIDEATAGLEIAAAFIKVAKEVAKDTGGEKVSAAAEGFAGVMAPIALGVDVGVFLIELANRPELVSIIDETEKEKLTTAIKHAYESQNLKDSFGDLRQKIKVTDAVSLNGGPVTAYKVSIGDIEGTIDAVTGRFSTADRRGIFRLAVARAQNSTDPIAVDEGESATGDSQKTIMPKAHIDWEEVKTANFKEEEGLFIVEDFRIDEEVYDLAVFPEGRLVLYSSGTPVPEAPPMEDRTAIKQALTDSLTAR